MTGGTGNERLEAFRRRREALNRKILDAGHLGIRRFFALDHQCYTDGALPGRTKELLGLVASLVLRCNDCVDYHVIQCAAAGYSDDELFDAFSVALVVGGSITIPHVRHAVATLEAVRSEEEHP